MTVIQDVSGRLLQSSGVSYPPVSGGFSRQVMPPMWSDGERWGSNGRTDGDDAGYLASYSILYNTQPNIAAVVDLLTHSIAALPLRVYRRKPGAKDREELTDHPLAKLIQSPMPRRSASSFKQWMALSCLIHGNSLVGLVRPSPGEPPEMLVPLDWSYTSGYADPGGPVEWWSTSQFDFGKQRFVKAEDTLHLAWEAPHSEIGVSPLLKLGVTIRNEDAAQRAQLAQFANGLRPSLAVTLPPEMRPDRESMARVRAELDAMHKGVDKNGKSLLLGPGMSANAISMTAVDVQLMAARKVNLEEVIRVYGLSGPLVNDLTHGTYSNVAELLRSKYRDILPPWLDMFESGIDAQIIRPLADAGFSEYENIFVEFDIRDKVKGEPEQLAAMISQQIATGVMTPNEGRALLNFPPDGDPTDPNNPANQLYLPTNNLQPLGTFSPRYAEEPQLPADKLPAKPLPPSAPPGGGNVGPPAAPTQHDQKP